jgi:pullulanase
MHRLALGILMTSQGIVFLHAGTEFRRTKKGVENSFESPDSINAIDWNFKSTHSTFYQYVRELIRMRKMHPAFRFSEQENLIRSIRFDETESTGVVRFQVEGRNANDAWKKIRVCYNGAVAEQEWNIGKGWKPAILNNRIIDSTNDEVQSVRLKPLTLSVLYQ